MKDRRQSHPHYCESERNETAALILAGFGFCFAVGMALGYLWGIS